jgi:flavin-dependent dehydrogenase
VPLEQLAIWGHYENADLADGPDAGSALFVQTQDRRAWFWFVPLPDNIAAIGVVGHPRHLAKGLAKPESAFEEQLVRCPAVVERLAAAKLMGPFRVARNFYAYSRQSTGDGWASVGDALGGWGPLFSFGLSLALRSGELAATAVVEALAHGDPSAARLGNWLEGFAEGEQALRKLVTAFTIEGFSPFDFLAEHPEHREPLAYLFSGNTADPATGLLLADLDAWILQHHPEAGRSQVMR